MSELATVILAFVIIGTSVVVTLWRTREKVQAIEKALMYEVIAMRSQATAMAAEIARRHMTGEPFDKSFFNIWRLSPPLIYPAVGANIGMLSHEALDRVGYFHAQLADARARLADARPVGGFEPSYYRVLSCLVRSANHVQPWLDTLQPDLGNADPDMSAADTLLNDLEKAAAEPRAEVYCWVDCPQTKSR